MLSLGLIGVFSQAIQSRVVVGRFLPGPTPLDYSQSRAQAITAIGKSPASGCIDFLERRGYCLRPERVATQ